VDTHPAALGIDGACKRARGAGGEKISPLDMEDQLLSVSGVETCVCFACPAELLGEVVGVAVVPKNGEPLPTLKDLRAGLPGTPMRFKPRVLVIMDGIPKGPTGKPKRIGLAKMLKIPAVDQVEDATFRVEGKGDDLGDLMRLTEKGEKVPVWTFPLRIKLDMNPDLGGVDRTIHELVIEDSLFMEYTLTVSSCRTDPPVSVDCDVKEKVHVKEALEYMKMHHEGRGLQWVAKCGERGRHEDFCAEATMSDGIRSLSHYWPHGCSDTPPGKLMRLLMALEYGNGLENDPSDVNSVWHKKEKELRQTASPPTGAA
jgi:hypothetical protein